MGKRITKAQALAIIKSCGDGLWAVLTEPITCAANTGDSGHAQTFAYDGKDIVRIEYPKARYRVVAYDMREGV